MGAEFIRNWDGSSFTVTPAMLKWLSAPASCPALAVSHPSKGCFTVAFMCTPGLITTPLLHYLLYGFVTVPCSLFIGKVTTHICGPFHGVFRFQAVCFEHSVYVLERNCSQCVYVYELHTHFPQCVASLPNLLRVFRMKVINFDIS